GLTAAAALLIDYVLTVAVSISAGVLALTSAVPALFPYVVPLGLGFIALITIGNLRGIRESGTISGAPAPRALFSPHVPPCSPARCCCCSRRAASRPSSCTIRWRRASRTPST